MGSEKAQPDTQMPFNGKGQFSKTLLFFCAAIVIFATIMITTAAKSVNVGQAGELSGFGFLSDIACIPGML